MTLQNFGQPLLLVAASACKCGGCMTLQKSAFRWLHEAANWHHYVPVGMAFIWDPRKAASNLRKHSVSFD